MEIPAAIPESFPADWCLAVAGSRTTAREFTRADGKRTKRHRHACESSICTDGLGTGESVDGQALRDHDRLRALQKVQDETVCHEWGSEGQEGGHGREQIAREIRNSFGIPEKADFYGTLANPAGSACIFVKLMK